MIFDREIAQALAVLQVTVILLLGRFCIKIELYGAIANLRLVNLIQNSFDSENLNQNQNELLESAESTGLSFHSYFWFRIGILNKFLILKAPCKSNWNRNVKCSLNCKCKSKCKESLVFLRILFENCNQNSMEIRNSYISRSTTKTLFSLVVYPEGIIPF